MTGLAESSPVLSNSVTNLSNFVQFTIKKIDQLYEVSNDNEQKHFNFDRFNQKQPSFV